MPSHCGFFGGRRFFLVFLASLSLLCFACGKKGRRPVYPVTGKVSVGGKPAKDAFVYFHPADNDKEFPFHPHGQVDAQGNFSVSTYEKNDGAPAGDYIVTIEWRHRSGLAGNNFEGPDRLNGKYKDPKTSKFQVNVTEGDNTITPFVLDP